jgi:hypothetical protein
MAEPTRSEVNADPDSIQFVGEQVYIVVFTAFGISGQAVHSPA